MTPNDTPNRNPLLPAAFLLLVVFVLLFFAFRLGITTLPTPSPVAFSQPSLAATSLPGTPSPTTTRTPRPTWTLRPSRTPTVTPTPTATGTSTPLPSLTPAKPLKYNDLYLLKPYTVDLASQIIQQLQSYPYALFPKPTDKLSSAYYAAFVFPAFAYQEALFRLPDESLTSQWQWNRAYDLARSNDPQAGALYANLLQNALQNNQVDLTTLPTWFSSQEQNLQLQVKELSSTPKISQSTLALIQNKYGGIALWITQDTTGYRVTPLTNYFDFTQPIQQQVSLGDLTGDQLPEVAITYSPSISASQISPPSIYTLSSLPLKTIPVEQTVPADLGVETNQQWTIENGDLDFSGTAFPSCPVVFKRQYHWDGNQLALQDQAINFQPDPNLLAYCETTLNHSLNFWGPETSIQLLQTLVPLWPPKADTQGNSYPPGARDQLRLQLGLEYALDGQMDQAKTTLTDLTNHPVSPQTDWAAQAQTFLQSYHTPEDLYRACEKVPLCNMRDALRQVMSNVPSTDYSQLPTYLLKFGVTQSTSGVFDFEKDGDPERWILIRPRPQDKLEFWILAHGPETVVPLFVQVSDTDQPTLEIYDSQAKPPIVELELHKGFILERVPGTDQPYLVHKTVEFIPTTFTLDRLNAAQADLFAGKDPNQVLQSLLDTKNDSHFNCRNYQICDRFYYLLGLANEMTGREQDAIDSYIKLWWENSASPYTVMARLKLETKKQASATVPVTATMTPSPTSTGVSNATPTPTSETYPLPTEQPTEETYPLPSEQPTEGTYP